MRYSFSIVFALAFIFVIAGVVYSNYKDREFLGTWADKNLPVKKFVIETNWVDLPANLEHPGHLRQGGAKLLEDAWIIGYSVEVIGATAHILHHIDFVNESVSSPFCPKRFKGDTAVVPHVFFASGKELTAGTLPYGYGYPVSSGTDISYFAMYHNPDPFPHYNTRVKMTAWYIPRAAADLKPVWPMMLDILGPCVWGDFAVPPGKTSKNMQPYTMPAGWQIVVAGGHLHNFGENMDLLVNGKKVLEFIPGLSDDKELISMPVIYPENLIIRKGDTLQIETNYNNPTDNTVDGMAEILLYANPQ